MYKVVIEDERYCNNLDFYFDDVEQAMDFCKYILSVSNYNIEIFKLSKE